MARPTRHHKVNIEKTPKKTTQSKSANSGIRPRTVPQEQPPAPPQPQP